MLLQMCGISRRFGRLQANQEVDLEVEAGELHALLGENGAGKTTLMRILAGVCRPDQGEIRLEGRPIQVNSPRQAFHHGIAMVHQHFMLVDTLNAVENIALLLDEGRWWKSSAHSEVAQRLDELADRYQLTVCRDQPVGRLSLGERQRVEILKSLCLRSRVLILDEPTAVLTPQESEGLFQVLARLKAEGHALILISHKLQEVLKHCDRVTVLRQGRRVASRPIAGLDAPELARLMMGTEPPALLQSPPRRHQEGRLQVEGLTSPGLGPIDLTVGAGEIVGVAGISGNGQTALAECLAGLRPVEAGRILLDGQDLSGLDVEGRIRRGLAYVPEDRRRHGSVLAMNLTDNAVLRDLVAPQTRGPVLQLAAMRDYALQLLEVLQIRGARPRSRADSLSGGNLQKFILARELHRKPRLLIAAQPTRGVDVGASRAIHDRLLAEREAGLACLLISEDLDELRQVSDRLVVMREGRLVASVPRDTSNQELGLLMSDS